MPIRSLDPFSDPFVNMRNDVNAFLGLLQNREASLPVLYGPELKPCKGRWRQIFTERREGKIPKEVVLEIGSHLGEVLLQMAQDKPDTAFIGMDITLKRVVTLAQKSQQLGCKNLISILSNAQAIDLLFADHELDDVIIFFPDPWNKKKSQLKKRLLSPAFLAVLARKIKVGGSLWFKTDCSMYQSDVECYLQAAHWQPKSKPDKAYTSKFERAFREQGLATFETVWSP